MAGRWMARFSRQCIALLEAALVVPPRAQALLKARVVLDASRMLSAAGPCMVRRGMPSVLERTITGTAAPVCLHGRVLAGQELPLLSVEGQDEEAEQEQEVVVAATRFVLGMEGGAKDAGLSRVLFVELMGILAPKWERATF